MRPFLAGSKRAPGATQVDDAIAAHRDQVWSRLFTSKALLHRFGNTDQRFHIELLGASVGGKFESSEQLVDGRFVQLVGKGAYEDAAEKLAAVKEERANEFVKKGQIAKQGALGRIRQDVNDGRMDLGPRPEDLRRHFADDFDGAQRLHPDAEG